MNSGRYWARLTNGRSPLAIAMMRVVSAFYR